MQVSDNRCAREATLRQPLIPPRQPTQQTLGRLLQQQLDYWAVNSQDTWVLKTTSQGYRLLFRFRATPFSAASSATRYTDVICVWFLCFVFWGLVYQFTPLNLSLTLQAAWVSRFCIHDGTVNSRGTGIQALLESFQLRVRVAVQICLKLLEMLPAAFEAWPSEGSSGSSMGKPWPYQELVP